MAKAQQKTVVLGLDGMDAKLTEILMRAGLLPNFQALASIGGFHKILSTTPAESAVAWTCFNMGTNPGATNVFDFIGRDIGSYSPKLSGYVATEHPVAPGPAGRWAAAAAIGLGVAGTTHLASGRLSRRKLLRAGATISAAAVVGTGIGASWNRYWPQTAVRYTSTVQGEPWWDRLGKQGQRCVALRIPMTFPAKSSENVRLLSGLGVPDLRGTNGTYLHLTDDGNNSRTKNTIPIHWVDGRCTIELFGPDDLRNGGSLTSRIKLEKISSGEIKIGTADGSFKSVTRGNWSDWIPLVFSISPTHQVRGACRIHFASQDPMHLYVSPIELESSREDSSLPISAPAGFGAELHQRNGQYRTIGWETQTWGLVDGIIDEHAYLSDAYAAIDSNIRQLESELLRGDWDNLMLVIQATDQIHHMFFDDKLVRIRGGDEIVKSHNLIKMYRRADEIVGRMANLATKNNWRFVVLSDHGFAPYRRALNINTWLAKRGWLAIKDKDSWDGDTADSVLAKPSWSNVDWSNTRAFAIGLSGIYFNIAGREPQGIVKRGSESAFLSARLKADLETWTDDVLGKRVCQEVYLKQNIYAGAYADAAPDLVLGLNEPYRVSAASAAGGIPTEPILDNRSHWQGDHCGIASSYIPGILFSNFLNRWPERVSIEACRIHIWSDLR